MTISSELQYLRGFGNEHESEALSGALPVGQFNPQQAPMGLYTEQFSTTAFTAPRHLNRRTWLYRIRPSVVQGNYQRLPPNLLRCGPITEVPPTPDQMRWDALGFADDGSDFIDSLVTMAANGQQQMHIGSAIHIYRANQDMTTRFFYNADGELLIVPQQGAIVARTEMGTLHAAPGEILVIPRGIKFQVQLPEGKASGYICENYGAPFVLPERGPVGANGYANDRDFHYPVACFEDIDGEFQLVAKFGGNLFTCQLDHSPLDVVAWVGTTAPYKYDLQRFNVINTVSFDHPDPSIFTVLTSPSDTQGVANVDFVIFPPRWMVAEHTFRPPWYHRNVMSEFMGLIRGVYDAKEEGFVPGGASLHNCMSPHGPEAAVFDKASRAQLQPEYYRDTLAFMFESRFAYVPTRFALECDARQSDYIDCWQGLGKHFAQRPPDQS